MKKLLMLFAVMTACAACEKDDGGITMEADRLEGTYWKQTRMECSEYRDGRWKRRSITGSTARWTEEAVQWCCSSRAGRRWSSMAAWP